MKLNVAERLQVRTYLPKESDFATVKIIRELDNNLILSADESKQIDAKTEIKDGKSWTGWNPKKAEKLVKDVKMGEIVTKIVVDKLEDLNKTKKLTIADIALYEKFIENKKA